ncbi:phosphatidylinositolglycan class N protein (macronuclear) [Tetrahymena thermophila SB210]|uniref:GPI ethanolamine phosphate transferase 1 n=1 Tax=Tetrahymena thermophila (strain SB210) TaxID=312017 RepID=I7LSW2_TETTS|nr:phosphatidylinositolglycan class N protein [Tetrahymena thermophila SB210]EAR83731.1 phosphatidylinositolglycan class N protein [Tetrahymena thermophila SB210]|eukprot:XP_001031394.1 phosphatidylinositolglycan class N protein [Tetrahymena thermophila SB210]
MYAKSEYHDISQQHEQIEEISQDNQTYIIKSLDIESNLVAKAEDVIKRQKKQNTFLWLTIGFSAVFHLVFLFSVFDVYIQAWKPLGMTPIESLNKSRFAKRVVIFQYDGGRADIIYGLQNKSYEPEIGKPRVPLIHNRIKEGKANFGIQHAIVPTESRVCVQNMMGGYQEDMTAILSGWTSPGPLKYDKLFNYVQAGLFFGPELLHNIFESSRCPSCVRADIYPDSAVNYNDHKQASTFDQLIYQKVTRLFNNGTMEKGEVPHKLLKEYVTLKEDQQKLQSEQLLIYMNWISSDAIGPAFKPINKEYHQSILTTGKLIEKVEEKIRNYYKDDGETVFILLSDHGMADNGAHGDGNPQNTFTPFVIWGASIKPAENELDPENPETHDEFSKKWGLTMKKRVDIDQNQLPSLISVLLGIPIPTNNEGVLPLHVLNINDLQKAYALIQNAFQLQKIYEKIQQLVQSKQKWFFTEYKYSPQYVFDSLTQLKQQVDKLETVTDNGKFTSEQQKEELKKIISDTYDELDNIKNGIVYLKLYQKQILQAVVGTGYASFMLLCLIAVFRYNNTSEEIESKIITQNKIPFYKNVCLILVILFGLFSLIYLNLTESKLVYYAYFGLPLYFLYQFYQQRSFLNQGWDFGILKQVACYILIAIAGQCLMYSFYERQFIGYNFIAVSIFSLIHAKYSFGKISNKTIAWSILCLMISVFPILPPISIANDIWYAIGFAAISITVFYFSFFYFKQELEKSVKVMTVLTLYCGGISLYLRTVSSSTVPYLVFGINWVILFSLIGSVCFLNLHKNSDSNLRLYSLVVVMCNLSLLFGISYDNLFYIIFACLLKAWIEHEKEISVLFQTDKIVPYHFYLLFKFILLMNISFFGIQDIVSLGSFNYESVTRFLANLNEVVTLALMVFNLAFPFLCGSSAFVIICRSAYQKLKSVGLFIISLIYAEIMTINFFLMVKTEGSWQTKGTSVARFVLSSMLVFLYTLLFFIAHYLFKFTKIQQV